MKYDDKHILNPNFEYTPSFATNISKTFAKEKKRMMLMQPFNTPFDKTQESIEKKETDNV